MLSHILGGAGSIKLEETTLDGVGTALDIGYWILDIGRRVKNKVPHAF